MKRQASDIFHAQIEKLAYQFWEERGEAFRLIGRRLVSGRTRVAAPSWTIVLVFVRFANGASIFIVHDGADHTMNWAN